MKKLLIIYLIISFLVVFVYAIFVVNAYVSIKYEVETIDNDAIHCCPRKSINICSNTL